MVLLASETDEFERAPLEWVMEEGGFGDVGDGCIVGLI